jgi:hypothetical protein
VFEKIHYAPRPTKKRACKKRRKSSMGLLKLLFLTVTYVNIALQGGNLRMSFLETRLQGYIITGMIFHLVEYILKPLIF